MMVVLAVIILAVMTAANVKLGRSILYPPAEFCAVWTVLLSLLLLCGDRFFSISPLTVLIYVAGAAGFCVGGILGSGGGGSHTATSHELSERVHRAIKKTLVTVGLALVALWPFYWSYLKSMAGRSTLENFWWAMRDETILQGEKPGFKSAPAFVFDNLSMIALFAALTAVAQQGKGGARKWLAAFLIVVALAYHLATASRSGAMLIVMGSIGITLMRGRSSLLRMAMIAVLGFSIAYVPTAIVLAKGGDPDEGVLKNVPIVWDGIILYAAGGMVAFDQYVSNPDAVTPNWGIERAVLLIANRLGADFSVPSLHAGFVPVAPDRRTNVYTAYFAYYPSFGTAGCAIILLIIGFWTTRWYRRARAGDSVAVILSGMAFLQISMTGFNEGFILGLNMWIKAALFGMLIYRGIPRLLGEGRNWSGSVAATGGADSWPSR
jgi:oligosaccharide repeat unit polymerase